jgi:hypothetical protein
MDSNPVRLNLNVGKSNHFIKKTDWQYCGVLRWHMLYDFEVKRLCAARWHIFSHQAYLAKLQRRLMSSNSRFYDADGAY